MKNKALKTEKVYKNEGENFKENFPNENKNIKENKDNNVVDKKNISLNTIKYYMNEINSKPLKAPNYLLKNGEKNNKSMKLIN